MNSQERILSALKYKTADRTPVFEYCLLSDSITKLVLERPYAQLHWEECVKEKGWQNSVRQLAVDVMDITEFFGFDMIYQVPNPAPPKIFTETGKNDENIIDDPVEKVRKRNELKRKSPAAVNEDSLLIYRFLREEMKRRGISVPILAPAYAHGVWTDIDLMQTMLLEPEVAHEHFAIATRNAEAKILKYFECGVEQIGIGGDFAGNAPLISPETYRAFIVPELRKLSDKIHSLGLHAVNASDGNLWGVIEDFLINTGVDGYLEVDEHAGMELKKLKAAYGEKITFYGNMDCGNILSFAPPEKIRSKTIQCIEDGLGNGGHIFTASNAITDSVPVENYFAMVNAYRNYFNLPKLK